MPSAFDNLCGAGKPLKAEPPDADEFAGLKRSGLARLKDGRGMYEPRQELIGNGVLAAEGSGYRFSQDYVFTSPSTAAAVVLGRSANGRIEWKDGQGRTLKELQAQEAAA